MYGDPSRIISAPIVLHWAGWKADTYSLQSAGWQLSAEEDLQRREMRIAVHHPDGGLCGVSTIVDFDYWKYSMNNHHVPMPIDVGMQVKGMTKQILLDRMSGSVSNFFPIDAKPRFTDVSMQRELMDLRKIAHFQPAPIAKHEVFLKEASIEEILEMALNKQEPTQEQIRKRIIKEQELSRYGELHTQLRLVA